MKTVMYEEMLLEDFEKAVEETPVAYIPCGLLEWHSSHLPLGIDGMKIEELGRRIATKYGGVVMPPFYVGAPGFCSYQGTMTYKPSTVAQVFTETFEQLIKVGFKVMVAIGGHYGRPQQESLERAASVFAGRDDVAVWVLNEADVINDIGIFGDHAGPWETSMGIELCGDFVDLSRFRPGSQSIKKYSVPSMVEEYDITGHDFDFRIEKDLRNCLDRDEIKRNVGLVVDRIGTHAGELLEKCYDV